MKKALFSGLLLLVAVIIIVAGNVGYSYLQTRSYLNRAKQLAAAQIEATRDANPHPSFILPGDNGKPPQPMYAATRQSTPPIVDPAGYGTEDNWIATSIAREIVEMAFIVTNGQQVLPDLKVNARVEIAKPAVHVEITGGSGSSVQIADLTPQYAWDSAGYAPLAQQLLGNTSSLPPDNTQDSDDLVKRLMNLTGTELATEDIALSTRLQQSPASWTTHEASALLLTALALRENAGKYSDNRLLLNRATAHLALARALRGGQAASWPGLLAETAVTAMAGREVSSLKEINGLEQRPDCLPAARTWLSALQMVAKQNWKASPIDVHSPLLLKIVWFQWVAHDLTDLVATHRLDAVVTNERTNPEASVPDWGRALVAPDYRLSVENGQRFTQQNFDLEFKELQDVLTTEGLPPVDTNNLASVFSEKEGDTISTKDGHPTVHVIGAGAFKAASLRHLFNDVKPAANTISYSLGQGPEGENFKSHMNVLFRGVPGYGFVEADVSLVTEQLPVFDAVSIEDAPVGLVSSWPEEKLALSFYARPVPFGTAYQVENRQHLLEIDQRSEFLRRGGLDEEVMRGSIRQMPEAEQAAAYQKLVADMAAHPERYHPQGLSSLEKSLWSLAPDSLPLATAAAPAWTFKASPEDGLLHRDHFALNATTEAFLDHNLRYSHSLEVEEMTDGDREALLRWQVKLEPDSYFDLATLLRVRGQEDEAAAMDRLGVQNAYDQVLVSNSVLPLLLYDLDHGLGSEALLIGKVANDVGSDAGMRSYAIVLERLNRFDEAEQVCQELIDQYQDETSRDLLYARNPSRYPDQYRKTIDRYFPHGLIKADLASFNGPSTGAIFAQENANTLRDGIHFLDVAVALDGYRVETTGQYTIICGLSFKPTLDLIIWQQQKKYVEIKAFAPGRAFGVDLNDFTPPQ